MAGCAKRCEYGAAAAAAKGEIAAGARPIPALSRCPSARPGAGWFVDVFADRRVRLLRLQRAYTLQRWCMAIGRQRCECPVG